MGNRSGGGGEVEPCVERHTVLAPKTGGVGDESGRCTSIQETKPLGRGDPDNESVESANPGAIEHLQPIPRDIQLDRVLSRSSPVGTF